MLGGTVVWFFVLKPRDDTAATTGTNSFRSFFSLGNKNAASEEEQNESSLVVNTSSSEETTASRFTQIGFGPIAGYTVFTVPEKITIPATDPKQKPTIQTVTRHILRYVSRTSGYVYEMVDGGTPIQISNIYIPNVYEALFADDGKTVLLRFLREDGYTIATYSIPIPNQTPRVPEHKNQGSIFQIIFHPLVQLRTEKRLLV